MSKNFIYELDTIAIRVKAARTAKGYSQLALAEKAGTSRSTISRIEKGESYFNLITLVKIADALDISFSDLMGQDFVLKDLKKSS